LRGARRVVIKVGTSIVANDAGSLNTQHLAPIAGEIANLRKEGRQVVLVSSGAVGLGAGYLGLSNGRLSDVVTKQSCAAVGQSLLMRAYEQLFGSYEIKIAQILLTEDDFTDWQRYQNLRRTTERLIKLGVLPIVNENDTVSIAELEIVRAGGKCVFSDNDRLAALVMSKLDADALIILTNVDGLLRRPLGRRNDCPSGENVEIVPLVTEITAGLKALARGRSASGRGGMTTKLEAAAIAMHTGGVAIIANGTKPDTLGRIFAGEEVGTAFASGARLKGKRRWIAFAAEVRGRLVVTPDARDAIVGGKASLLASGVVRIEDHFESLDVVSIVDSNGSEFARGMANCPSREADKLIRSAPTALAGKGYGPRAKVLVTRNNIVLLET